MKDIEQAKNELVLLIPQYYQNNTQAAQLKKIVEAGSKRIKELFEKTGYRDLMVGDLMAAVTITKKEVFNEDRLLEYIKKQKIKGLVKKREYVDMEALEDAIYHGLINPVDLAPFQEVTETPRLTVKPFKKAAGNSDGE